MRQILVLTLAPTRDGILPTRYQRTIDQCSFLPFHSLNPVTFSETISANPSYSTLVLFSMESLFLYPIAHQIKLRTKCSDSELIYVHANVANQFFLISHIQFPMKPCKNHANKNRANYLSFVSNFVPKQESKN